MTPLSFELRLRESRGTYCKFYFSCYKSLLGTVFMLILFMLSILVSCLIRYLVLVEVWSSI